MIGVKGGYPDHVMSLLGLVVERLRREVEESAERSEATSVVGTLRPSQLRLLSLAPVDGLRVTDLADRLGMTKQALGEFANDLEARGLLESLRDPVDRRVRILRPTELGRHAVEATESVIRGVEDDWRERLEPGEWDRLRALLIAVHNAGDDA